MKRIIVLLLAASAFTAAGQKKAPKMEPMTSPGYYVNQKGDTVKGEVRTNPEDETEFYQNFSFKPEKGGKLMPVMPLKAKAYGFEGKHFVRLGERNETMYVERLAEGRLNFFKRRFNGKVDGVPGIETEYYMQDTRAEAADAKLKEVNKISTKFYKKDLKNYMKDQPMIWSDLDKFNFDENAVIRAINEFNSYYVVTAN